jgi:hypothetical protein
LLVRGHRRRAHRRRLVIADSHRQSPHRRFFVSGLFVYLFPRIEGRPIGRGRPTFRTFGKQLAALFAKILAFQAIILAF